MRTRKANKSKRFSYTEAYSDESEDESDTQEAQEAGEDVDFQEPEPDGGSQDASDEDVVDEGVENNKLVDVESDGEGEVDLDEVESPPGKAGPRRGRLRRKLLKRGVVHAIPAYPTELRNTRVYEGPLQRSTRGMKLLEVLYGPDPGHIKVAQGMLNKWFNHQVLPVRGSDDGGLMQSPWLADDYEEKQRNWTRSWYDRYRAGDGKLQRLRKIRQDHVDIFKPPMTELVCLVGRFNNQKQIRTRYGSAHPVSETGELWQAAEATSQNSTPPPPPPKGWLFDTGGIPLAIGWAPLIGHREQFLAVCTVPFSDQDRKDADSPEDDPEEKKKGSVQIWSIPCHKEGASDARLVHSLSFDWGRPKRLQWCPVPLLDDSKIGMLAIICADGQARVIEVSKSTPGQENYDWITSPVATFGITDEYAVHATCLTWVNTNRLCLGHSDGSITLWSIYPQRLLTRHAAHTSQILDIASGFPSHPYHIATVPIGGSPTLTDLNLPSAETTYIPLSNCVNFQPNLLDWNDHLQGYLGISPSGMPHNISIGFTHIRHFVQSRTLMTTPSLPMCLAGGRTHPFTLVGCADGSLWAFNPLRVLTKERGDRVHKLKVLQHEFRPPPQTGTATAARAAQDIRGAARILQGFRPEFNSNPRASELTRELNRREAAAKAKRPKSKNPRRRAAGQQEEFEQGDNGLRLEEELALLKETEKTKVVVHEALTRITAAAWNPNVEHGWWAAAAMGSGLVKIMDLGLKGWNLEEGSTGTV
ncbi:hypothetical protein M406DRAFT_254114 [Cryphonectria parasitica EP155]|uniref:Transcription factor TFIIIC complex subunit Tfc6 n=1 Tax=Cryphonectria parasitica (strain ATCC 38755 / EP155) TaxID=660469 RepID=A0A9P4Y605_CRYP1|nr:uncharacterized protein M406DRAFT_254114 [Cryphonectria parasitica EP155]KAF3767183.1 hypothetical protein M406DRAFT_254114 [Cryphonectria parasitica EP155]